MEKQRIDKWLWYARMLRTRCDAASFVEAGHARINGARTITPGHPVRLGDVITLALDRSVRVIGVAGFAERRGDAKAARRLYRDMAARQELSGPPKA
jgi:ribosome-associated heat shock protein Hsp15